MDHEISAKQPGGEHKSQWLWIPLIAVFIILLIGFGYLPLIQSKVSAQQPGPDLSIQKVSLGDFLIGETGTYSITVSNVGSAVVSGTITVTDVLPENLSNISVTAAGWDANNCGLVSQTQTVTCVHTNSAGLAAGSSLPDIFISADVNPITTTQIINTASVANTNDINNNNNSVSTPTNVVGADLSVSKTVIPASPAEGGVITYTLTVRNLGPSQATGVVLTDTLPAEVTFQNAQASQGSYTNASGLWSVGTLANNVTATLRLRAVVGSDTLGQTIINTAQGLKSDINDFDLANNTASVSFTIQTTQVSGLVLDAATDDPISAASVQLTDSASHTYTLNTAPNGWYTFTNTITTPITAGAATLRVSKTGYVSKTATPTLVAGQNTRQDFSLDTADLLFTKSDGLTTVSPGQTITYTMVISNVGTIPAASVVITDVLPSTLTFITATLGIKPSIPASLTYVWKLVDEIDPGEAVRFGLRVRVADSLPSPATAITNQARVTTTSPEANTANNIAQDTSTSSGTPNPSITISVSPNQVRVNQNATYTIIVKNTGTAAMTDVVVDDTFSTLLDITNVTTTKGTATRNNSTRQVTVSIGTVNPNDEVTIRVVTRVASNPSTNITVTNSARLTYKFGGSTFTRTSSSVSLQILVSTTLPGTGGIELPAQSSGSRSYLLAFVSAVLLLVLSIVAFVYAVRTRGQNSEWSSWAVKMGVMLGVVALLFGAAGGLLLNYTRPSSQPVAVLNESTGSVDKQARQIDTEPHTLVWPGVTPQIPGSELDALPDFPIPTPTVSASSGSESDLDLTPVNRVIIPAITLDTVVKYVPFDGITWLIAGLKQEVAWMGDTSWPGLGSNTALAGHVTLRDGSNGPFRYIYDLVSGDAIFVYTDQYIYEYKVRDQRTVEETDLSVVWGTDKSQLTLITCAAWDPDTGFYTKRYIVNADLVGSKVIVNQPPLGN